MPSYSGGKKPMGRKICVHLQCTIIAFLSKKKQLKWADTEFTGESVKAPAAEGVALYVRCGVLCLTSLFFHSFCPSYFVKHGLQDDNKNCRPVSAAVMEFRDGCHRLNHNGIKEGGQSTDWKQVTGLGGLRKRFTEGALRLTKFTERLIHKIMARILASY